jgi:putative PIN family toxin of toxin-antitoxin system
MLKVVFDSNVYISALLFGGSPRKILELAREHRVTLIASPSIINETARKLREKFSWPEHRIGQFVRNISKLAELYNPKEKLSVLRDEADNRVLECAIAGGAHLIISGDKHLLKLKTYQGIPIQTPKYLTYLITQPKEL